MRISPLDIQKHRFRQVFRGLDPAEVRSFLSSVAEAHESVARENAQLREQASILREQVREHEERERILKDTLLAAQAAADQLRDQARREAEIVVKEAELKADKMMEVARERIGKYEGRLVELKALKRDLVEQVRSMLSRQSALLSDWQESDAGDNLKFLEPRRAAQSGGPAGRPSDLD
jgi:cell division initiation protein